MGKGAVFVDMYVQAFKHLGCTLTRRRGLL